MKRAMMKGHTRPGPTKGQSELTPELVKKIMTEGRLDTENYRYKLEQTSGMWVIFRIELAALDTTAALTQKSDTNPNGWDSMMILNI